MCKALDLTPNAESEKVKTSEADSLFFSTIIPKSNL